MNIGIVILTKGNLDILFSCLDSIKRFTKKAEYTVYVADTGSTAEERETTVEYIKDKFSDSKNCKFYKLNYYNFARCNNFIINEVVKEDYVLLCNNDVELMDNSIDLILDRMMTDSKIGTGGCRLIYPQNGTIQHGGQFVRVGRFSKDHKVSYGSHLSCGHRGQFTTNTYADWEPVMGNTGGYMFVERSKYLKAGGLNEKYKICFEDVEFNLSMYKHGYRNMYCDTVQCKHYESLTRGTKMDWTDHQNILTPYFNSLPMDVKTMVTTLPDQ